MDSGACVQCSCVSYWSRLRTFRSILLCHLFSRTMPQTKHGLCIHNVDVHRNVWVTQATLPKPSRARDGCGVRSDDPLGRLLVLIFPGGHDRDSCTFDWFSGSSHRLGRIGFLMSRFLRFLPLFSYGLVSSGFHLFFLRTYRLDGFVRSYFGLTFPFFHCWKSSTASCGWLASMSSAILLPTMVAAEVFKKPPLPPWFLRSSLDLLPPFPCPPSYLVWSTFGSGTVDSSLDHVVYVLFAATPRNRHAIVLRTRNRLCCSPFPWGFLLSYFLTCFLTFFLTVLVSSVRFVSVQKPVSVGWDDPHRWSLGVFCGIERKGWLRFPFSRIRVLSIPWVGQDGNGTMDERKRRWRGVLLCKVGNKHQQHRGRQVEPRTVEKEIQERKKRMVGVNQRPTPNAGAEIPSSVETEGRIEKMKKQECVARGSLCFRRGHSPSTQEPNRGVSIAWDRDPIQTPKEKCATNGNGKPR